MREGISQLTTWQKRHVCAHLLDLLNASTALKAWPDLTADWLEIARRPDAGLLSRCPTKPPEQTIAFGRPFGVTVNHAQDRAVRYDLREHPIERRVS